ncbi:MAG TPA: DegV family protein [Erysipelotrichaceae bacterium]|nr:DegV family protein [Erysipelotrichaceae bacterium]
MLQGVKNMAIEIIVDSGCDLTVQQAQQMNLILLPFVVRIGNTDYLDRVSLSAEEFYEKLIEETELPKTSQISPYAYQEAVNSVKQRGNQALIITITSRLSGSHRNALLAAQQAQKDVVVIDSLSASIGEQLLVKRACQLRDEGRTLLEMETILNDEKKYIHIIALLDTLEYLKKGGRISKAASIAGSLLGIRPVIKAVGGQIEVIGKARGSRSGNNLLIQEVVNSGGIRFDMPYALAYSGLSDRRLQKYIADSRPLYEGKTDSFPISICGSTIGTYAGPEAVICAWFANKPCTKNT